MKGDEGRRGYHVRIQKKKKKMNGKERNETK